MMTGPFWLSGCLALNDILNQTVLIYLFVKPLIILAKQQSTQPNISEGDEFRNLCLKYYILGLNASLSTIVFLFSVPILGSGIFIAMDCVVNSLCLLFCFHHWEKQYRFVCKGCMVLVETFCFRNNAKGIKMQIQVSMNSLPLTSSRSVSTP
eukprot:UN13345